MIVAILRLTFMVPPDGGSNKSIAQKIKDRLWTKFKLAVADLGTGRPGELMIGASFVSPGGTGNESSVRDRVQEIIRHLNDWPSVELVYDEVEVVQFDDLELERDFEKYDQTP